MAQHKQITPLRSASMGIVSGIKGGFVMGALAGGTIMVLHVLGTEQFPTLIYVLITGMTSGSMAGAVMGAFMGFLSGAFCGALWQRDNAALAIWPWFAWGAICAGLVGFMLFVTRPWLGALLGLLCGLAAAWLAQRDYQRIFALQLAPPETNPTEP